jgi:hypothetical protein
MSQPLLTYACTTDPFPLQASPASGTAVATVQVVATNATGAAVALSAMSIQLPLGPAANALTLDPTSIGPVPPTGWTTSTQGPAGVFLFTPGKDAGTVPVGGSLVFILTGVQVNQAAGTAMVTVAEGSGGCEPGECPTTALAVTKFPAGWGNVEFLALTPYLRPGGDASVQWSGPVGATYTLQYFTPATGPVTVPAQGAPPLGASGVYPGTQGPALPLRETTVFTLGVAYTAGGNVYSAQRQATVVVMEPAPTITLFDGELGGTLEAPVLTLTWETENAAGCQLTGTSEQLDPQGTLPLPNAVDTGPILPVYTLTAFGAPGPAATAVFKTPPQITLFTATPLVSGAGMQLQLSWTTILGEECAITGVSDSLPASGTVTLTPTVQAPLQSDYTLTVQARGKSDTATLSLQWGSQPNWGTGVFASVATGIAATPDGTQLLVYANPSPFAGNPTVMNYFSPTLEPLYPPSVTTSFNSGPIAIDPSGTRTFTVSSTRLACFELGGAITLPGAGPFTGVAVSAGGDRVFVCSGPTVVVVNAQTLGVTGQFDLPGPATSVAATPDGRQLVFRGEAVLYLVDAQTYVQSAPPVPIPAEVTCSYFPPGSVAVTPDSAVAVVGPAGPLQTMAAIDLRTGAAQLMALGEPGNITQLGTLLTLSPDGSRLYAAVNVSMPRAGASMGLTVYLRTGVSGGVGG